MGWATVAVALLSFYILLPQRAAAEGFLSPLLSPILNETCKLAKCGKGSCQPSLSDFFGFGFVCNCQPGWTQLHIDDHLRFLPCVIPNCSLNYSCSNDSLPQALPPSPSPSPSNYSLFDPCSWSFCGGGSCVKMSTSEHRCACKEGYSNLLNATSFPCFKDCSIGGDCANLGITLSNSSASSSSPAGSTQDSSSGRGESSSPTGSTQDSSSGRDYSAHNNLPWLFLMASLTVIQVTWL